MIEVAIQGAKNIRAPNHGDMDHGIVIGIRGDNSRRRSWKNSLRNMP